MILAKPQAPILYRHSGQCQHSHVAAVTANINSQRGLAPKSLEKLQKLAEFHRSVAIRVDFSEGSRNLHVIPHTHEC